MSDIGHEEDGGWQMTPRQLMDYALAAFRNAQSLLRDSRLLAERRRYSRAASLAIIGSEEAGKALVLVLAGMGKIGPDRLPGVLRSLRYGRDSHRSKQAVSIVPRLLGDTVASIRPIMRRAVRKLERTAEQVGSFQNLLADLAKSFSPSVLAELQRIAPEEESVNKEVKAVSSGSWQRVRDAGLYVDFQRGRLHEPRTVSRGVAMDHIDSLNRALRGLRPLVPIAAFPDEALAVVSGATPGFDSVALLEELWRHAGRLRRLTAKRSRRKR